MSSEVWASLGLATVWAVLIMALIVKIFRAKSWLQATPYLVAWVLALVVPLAIIAGPSWKLSPEWFDTWVVIGQLIVATAVGTVLATILVGVLVVFRAGR